MSDIKPTYTANDGSNYSNPEQAQARNELIKAEREFRTAQEHLMRAMTCCEYKTSDGEFLAFGKTYYYPRKPFAPRAELINVEMHFYREFLFEPNNPPRIIISKDLTIGINELYASPKLAAEEAKKHFLSTIRNHFVDARRSLKWCDVNISADEIAEATRQTVDE